MEELNLKSHESVNLNKTLSDANTPIVKNSGRMTRRKEEKKIRRNLQQNDDGTRDILKDTSSSFASMIASKLSRSKEQGLKKSMYDADLDGHYVVSPQQSIDEEDEHPFNDLNGSNEDQYYSEDDSLSDADGHSENLESDVGQTLTQTLNYVQLGSRVSKKSLLQKAIGDKLMDAHKSLGEFEVNLDRVFELSPVGKRLWCFFVAYNNHKCPEDNYLQQVKSILEDLEFGIVEKLIDLAVPEFAVKFMKTWCFTCGINYA